jgi:hypothetical protein
MSRYTILKKIFRRAAIIGALIIILFLTAVFLRIHVFNSTPF